MENITRNQRTAYVFEVVANHDYDFLIDQYEFDTGRTAPEKFQQETADALAGYTYSELVEKIIMREGLPFKALSKVSGEWVLIERRGGRTPTGAKNNPEIVIFEKPVA